MEQGFRLLIKLIIECAPVIANLLQKNNDVSVDLSSKQKTAGTQALIQSVNNSNQQINYIEGFEQENIEQQQLALSYRQMQLRIANQVL